MDYQGQAASLRFPRTTVRDSPAIFALSSNDEHGTVRILHHARRHAAEEKPIKRAQPLGPHHDQIDLLFRSSIHDLFSGIPQPAYGLGPKSRLDQLLHALVD